MVLASLVLHKSVSGIKTTSDVSNDTPKCTKLCVDIAPVISQGMKNVYLVLTYMFIIVELFLLVFAINIARKTKEGPERYVNIILAVTLTTPYLLLKTAFSNNDMSQNMSPTMFGASPSAFDFTKPL